MSVPLTNQVIRDPNDFFALESEWLRIEEDSDISFFLSFSWLSLWWKYYSQNIDQLYIITVRDEGKQLLAVAPFYLQSQSVLRFIGTGEDEHEEVVTEYLDIICLKSHKASVLPIIATELHNRLKQNIRCVFDNYLADSNLAELVKQFETYCWINNVKCGLRYQVKLPTGQENKGQLFSENLYKQILRQERKFFNKLKGKVVKATDLASFNTLFESLITLHQYRWQQKGKAGAFASSKFQQFHTNFCHSLLFQKKLQLWGLAVNTDLISVIYAIDHKKTRYFYQIGVDTLHNPNVSPGNLLHWQMIKDAENNGFCFYDFMKGSLNNSYKSKFANETTDMFNATVVKKKWSNIIYLLKWWLKKYRIQ